MTRVSKRPLRKDLEDRMFAVFWQCFADLKSASDVFEFLDDLLSPAEKIMLAKRLAIAVLIEKGWNYDQISSAVKVSTATVNSIRSRFLYHGRGFRKVTQKILTNEEMSDFLEELGITLASMLAPKGSISLLSGAEKIARAHHHEQKRKRDIL